MLKVLFFSLLLTLLSGCEQASLDKVKMYVENIKKQKQKPIEPLPVVSPYKIVNYDSENLPDPFLQPIGENEKPNTDITGLHPDFNRKLEPLEAFPLEALAFVGTLEKESTMYALIKEPAGNIYRVHKGNYLGQHHGKIVNILQNKIEVNEIVPDNKGGWQERSSAILLGEQN